VQDTRKRLALKQTNKCAGMRGVETTAQREGKRSTGKAGKKTMAVSGGPRTNGPARRGRPKGGGRMARECRLPWTQLPQRQQTTNFVSDRSRLVGRGREWSGREKQVSEAAPNRRLLPAPLFRGVPSPASRRGRQRTEAATAGGVKGAGCQ